MKADRQSDLFWLYLACVVLAVAVSVLLGAAHSARTARELEEVNALLKSAAGHLDAINARYPEAKGSPGDAKAFDACPPPVPEGRP